MTYIKPIIITTISTTFTPTQYSVAATTTTTTFITTTTASTTNTTEKLTFQFAWK